MLGGLLRLFRGFQERYCDIGTRLGQSQTRGLAQVFCSAGYQSYFSGKGLWVLIRYELGIVPFDRIPVPHTVKFWWN